MVSTEQAIIHRWRWEKYWGKGKHTKSTGKKKKEERFVQDENL
jgi:hypothetical protein